MIVMRLKILKIDNLFGFFRREVTKHLYISYTVLADLYLHSKARTLRERSDIPYYFVDTFFFLEVFWGIFLIFSFCFLTLARKTGLVLIP